MNIRRFFLATLLVVCNLHSADLCSLISAETSSLCNYRSCDNTSYSRAECIDAAKYCVRNNKRYVKKADSLMPIICPLSSLLLYCAPANISCTTCTACLKIISVGSCARLCVTCDRSLSEKSEFLPAYNTPCREICLALKRTERRCKDWAESPTHTFGMEEDESEPRLRSDVEDLV